MAAARVRCPLLATVLSLLALGFFTVASAVFLPLAASAGYAVPGAASAAAAYLASLLLGLAAAALAGVRPIRRGGDGRALDWEGEALPDPGLEGRIRIFFWLLVLVLAAAVLQAAGSAASAAFRDFREEAYGPPPGVEIRSPYDGPVLDGDGYRP